ncbi:MAG: tRNA (adenosine(37)-N6)-threonylcarbamoyltransferase complex dimerization subunit type 1 TsaB [Simkaniaceae bacterium]|nr:MAG: tRNA (adenosine(37)-N6)-threonylcarbamoyltransferase complex dimerization subunit type 1 TsaB [Simkaniaceae bacterium]
MNFLIIDTSSPQSFVALSRGDNLIIEHLPPLKQSQALLPAIEKLLENTSIDFIAIGTGPGSFTGTRVGVMAAKALSFSKEILLLPFCSLKIFTPNIDGPFTLYGDAKSRGFYALDGEKSGGSIKFDSPRLVAEGSICSTLNILLLKQYLLEKFHRAPLSNHAEIIISYLLDLEPEKKSKIPLSHA